MISTSEAQTLLTRAIWDGDLASVARELLQMAPGDLDPDARALVAAAASCCTSIAAYNRSERARMADLLGAGGARVVPGAGETASPQLRAFALRLPPDDLPVALAVANEEGYHGAVAPPDRAELRSRSQLTLVNSDQLAAQMTLRWRDDDRVLHRIAGRVRRTVGRSDTATSGPYLATPDDLIPPLLDVAEVTAADVVMDLGCGDGRVVVEAARLRGCRARGVERSAALVERGRSRAEAASLRDLVSIEHGDLAGVDLDGVTVVFGFLPIRHVARHLPRLRSLLRPASRIIVHEQSPLDPRLRPDRSLPVIGPSSLTVAHLWSVT